MRTILGGSPMRGNYLFSRRLAALIFASAFTLSAQTQSPTTPWQLQPAPTKASLRGIHAVSNEIAWASGTNGAVLRTQDGGSTWKSCPTPPGAEKLDFRGVWAWDANTAVVISSGTGDLSRLYKTTDGCSSWKLLYTNPDKDGFWDAVQFWDRDHGFLLGDPVSSTPFKLPNDPRTVLPLNPQRFLTLQTDDAGGSWAYRPALRGSKIEPGKKGAGAFAASNSSIFFLSNSFEHEGRKYFENRGWIGIGGVSGAFIYSGFDMSIHSPELGFGWSDAVPVPLASGNESSGVFSLAFRDQNHGIAAGGDYKKPNEPQGTAAFTTDGGKTWTAATQPPHGYRSTVAWDATHQAWIAAGTNGSDISYDDGKTWQPLDNGNWNALSLPWVVGPDGRIAKLVSLDITGKSAAPPAK